MGGSPPLYNYNKEWGSYYYRYKGESITPHIFGLELLKEVTAVEARARLKRNKWITPDQIKVVENLDHDLIERRFKEESTS